MGPIREGWRGAHGGRQRQRYGVFIAFLTRSIAGAKRELFSGHAAVIQIMLGLGDIEKHQGDLAGAQKSYVSEPLPALKVEDPARAKKAAAERAEKEHLAAIAAEQAKRDIVATWAPPKPVSAKLVPEDIEQLLHHRRHALLIGVSNYTTGWDKLPSVKNDLHGLAAGLAPHFETVDTVQNRGRDPHQNA